MESNFQTRGITVLIEHNKARLLAQFQINMGHQSRRREGLCTIHQTEIIQVRMI